MASDPRTLLLATRSRDKVREIGEILAGSVPYRLVSLAELGVPHSPDEDAVEAFQTFHENAIAKATYFAALAHRPTLADDSGLCVDALGGDPGVRSKRFAERPGLHGLALDRANNAKLLARLRDVPAERRTAHYVCAAAFVDPASGRPPVVALGSVSGRLLETERGLGGFGYDPIFLLPRFARTFAEFDHEKRFLSHRSRAFRALAGFLPDAHTHG